MLTCHEKKTKHEMKKYEFFYQMDDGRDKTNFKYYEDLDIIYCSQIVFYNT